MSKRSNLDEWYKNGALMDAVNADGIVLSDYWTRKAEARIIELAWEWIDEMRGHDGECNCRHEATILQQFIEHPEFKGKAE